MSISEQVKELRAWADSYYKADFGRDGIVVALYKAADTIESLSAKLQAADMKRSAEDCGGGRIIASECMPEEHKCIDPETGYYGQSDNVLCSAYNEYEMRDEIWIDYTIDGEWQTHEWYEGEKLAWMPLPSPYRESNEP